MKDWKSVASWAFMLISRELRMGSKQLASPVTKRTASGAATAITGVWRLFSMRLPCVSTLEQLLVCGLSFEWVSRL